MALERVNGLNNPREQSLRLIAIPFSLTELFGETWRSASAAANCRLLLVSAENGISTDVDTGSPGDTRRSIEPSERFTSTQIESVDVEWTFADAADYGTFLVGLTALGPLVGSLSDAARADPRTASSY
jgi:hypothetical protein